MSGIKGFFRRGKKDKEESPKAEVQETAYSLDDKPWSEGKFLDRVKWGKRVKLFREGLAVEYQVDKGDIGQFYMNETYAKLYATGESSYDTVRRQNLELGLLFAPSAIGGGHIENPEEFVSSLIGEYLAENPEGSIRMNNPEMLKTIQESPEGYVQVSEWAFKPSASDFKK